MARQIKVGDKVFLRGTLIKGKVTSVFDKDTFYVLFKEGGDYKTYRMELKEVWLSLPTHLSIFIEDVSVFFVEKLKVDSPLKWTRIVLVLSLMVLFQFIVLMFK